MAQISLSVLIAASLLPFLPYDSFVLDLFSHFRVQYLVCASLCCAAGVFLRSPKHIILSSVSVVANVLAIVPYLGVTTSHQPKPTLRLALTNINSANSHYAEVRELFEKEKPDLLLALELTKEWEEYLKEIFPYESNHSSQGNFGIGLYSRLPIASSKAVALDTSQPVNMFARVMFDGKQIQVVGAHPVPPLSSGYYARRNQHLQMLAKWLSSSEDPTLLIGDLNTSMWSSAYRQFLTDSSLREARAGQGILPSWPTQLPVLLVPIDHCLHSEHWKVTSIRTIKIPGSDHYGLVVDLGLSEKGA